MIVVRFHDPGDAARVVEALLEQADAIEPTKDALAARYRRIADDVGDGLDGLPVPSGWRERVADAKGKHRA